MAIRSLIGGRPSSPKRMRHRLLQREVAGREDVGMAGAEHQVDLGRPRADALDAR